LIKRFIKKTTAIAYIYGNKRLLRSLRSLDHAALSLTLGVFNSNYAESPSARDISQIVYYPNGYKQLLLIPMLNSIFVGSKDDELYSII